MILEITVFVGVEFEPWFFAASYCMSLEGTVPRYLYDRESLYVPGRKGTRIIV